MTTTELERRYRYAGGLMVRVSPHAQLELPAWPDVSGTSAEHVAAWRQWLQQVQALPGVADVLAHASPDLAARVEAVCQSQERPKAKRVRRIVLSVARYLLRMRYRPTPFGLIAGVAPARFDATSSTRWGGQHQAVPSANAGWLDHLISSLEAHPQLRDRLTVLVNNAVAVRGDRLVLPHQSHPDHRGPVAVSLRLTDPLRVAVETARSPVLFAALVEKVTAECGTVSAERVSGMLAELLRYRVLITDLRPVSTSPDLLEHLVTRLEQAGADEFPAAATTVQDLRAVRHFLDGSARREDGRASREAAVRIMTGLTAASSPLDVDLRLDCDVVLPNQVARVAEDAAGLLARLSPYPAGTAAWQQWRDRFLDRYGTDRLVPVREVVDPEAGLGYPAGYPGTTGDEPESLPARDQRLLELAQSAALDGQREIVLDDQRRAALTATGDQTAVPAHTELTLRIESASRASLDSGRFRLIVLGAARDAGTMTGRFARLLDDYEYLADRLRRQPTGCVPVQLSFPPLRGEDAHIARVPRLTEHVLSLAEHHPSGRGVLGLADLAVGCDETGLYLASHALGRRITPVVPHALNLRMHTPPLARFLAELPTATNAMLTGFDWGAATRLPFLPRLRTGRIVLSGARWRLAAGALAPHTASWMDWVRSFEDWAARRGLPEVVELGAGDQRLRLDLTEHVPLKLLRTYLDSTGNAVLTESPTPGALGWCDGQPHEVVVPLSSVERTLP